MQYRRTISGLAMLVGWALLGTACARDDGTSLEASGDASRTSAPSSIVAAPADGGKSDAVTDLNRLTYHSDADGRLIWNARESITLECMTQLGLQYTSIPYPEGPVASDDNAAWALTYPDDELVNEWGYEVGFAQRASATTAAEFETPADELAQPGYDAALNSCGQQVAASLDESRYADLATNVSVANAAISIAVDESPEMASVQRAWSDCMKSAGYSFETPMRAWERGHASLGWGERPSAPAIAIALADLACERQVRYLETRVALITSRITAWIEDNGAVLTELEAAKKSVVERARAVVAAAG